MKNYQGRIRYDRNLSPRVRDGPCEDFPDHEAVLEYFRPLFPSTGFLAILPPVGISLDLGFDGRFPVVSKVTLFGLGGSLTSGNTDTQSVHASGTLTVKKGWHRIILDGRANRGGADGKLTAKNGALNARWDYFFSKRIYIPVINFSEYDKFQKLTYRNTSIVGGGYDVLDRRANFLTVAAGPTAIYENYGSSGNRVGCSGNTDL